MPPGSCSALAGLEESWGLGLERRELVLLPQFLGYWSSGVLCTSLPSSGGSCLCWEVLEAELRRQDEVEGAAQPRSCLQHGWAGDCSLFYIIKLYYGFVLIINVPLSPHLLIKPSPFVRGCSWRGGGRTCLCSSQEVPSPSAPLLSPTLPCSVLLSGGCFLCQAAAWHGGSCLVAPGQGTSASPEWGQLCPPSPGSCRGAELISLPVLSLFSTGMRRAEVCLLSWSQTWTK